MTDRTVRCMLFALVFASSIPLVQAGENCTCRYDGKDVLEGASICMKTPNGMQMAECGRVLNNTAWKFTGKPCPYADLNFSPIDPPLLTKKPVSPAQSG